MNQYEILDQLCELGLNEKEARIYLAALPSGFAPASLIAEKAQLNRITAYGILENLLEKGLVEQSIKAGTKTFRAANPRELLQKFRFSADRFENQIPQLEKLMHDSVQAPPQIRLFEGMEGVKRAYHETLHSETEILSYANSQNVRFHWPTYDTDYVSRRAEKKIFLRGLAPDDSQGKAVQEEDEKCLRELRLIDRNFFPTDKVENEINLFDNKMMIASFAPEPFATIIESPAVYQTQKQIFEVMWNFAAQK